MRSTMAFLSTLCFFSVVGADDMDNPFKNAKVGDWVEYKMTSSGEGKFKLTVVAKDDKEVTYETTGSTPSMEKETTEPTQKVKIDLTKPYDLIMAGKPASKDTKIEKLCEGKEKLKLGNSE